MFAAELALPSTMPRREKIQRVNEMIRNLGLQNQANTLIGTALQKGCSGGQKRRVTVGSQLITSPSILFLDEVPYISRQVDADHDPDVITAQVTSGLDSVASSEVVKAIRGIAKANNVRCFIHRVIPHTYSQPTSSDDGHMLHSSAINKNVQHV